jgi:hypothetical protein
LHDQEAGSAIWHAAHLNCSKNVFKARPLTPFYPVRINGS